MIIRGERIVAAGALLPLAETIDPHRAVRDAPPGGPRHHRADRRRRRRGLRGERPDQPRRARADRAQPERGPARPRDPQPARSQPRPPTPAALGWRSSDAPTRDAPTLGRDGPRGDAELIRVIVHNWPLKLAAIGLATLLYGGLVLSQSTQTFTGRRPGRRSQPADRHVPARPRLEPVTTDPLLRADRRPADRARPSPATVDLAGVAPGGGPQLVPIDVTAARPADHASSASTPRRHDASSSTRSRRRTVPVVVERGATPDGLELGDTTVDPTDGRRCPGPTSVVEQVVAARADVAIQPAGIDVDQDVQLVAGRRARRTRSARSTSTPPTARVTIPVFTDRQTPDPAGHPGHHRRRRPPASRSQR